MGLTGAQRKQIVDALCAAFTSRDDLARLAMFCLDANLAEISQATTLRQDAFALAQWAEKRGQLRTLIECAVEENAGNPLLQAVAQWDLTPSLPGTPGAPAPFMAPALPHGFVQRPKEFDHLKRLLLAQGPEGTPGGPVAITTALHGAGGFGKPRPIHYPSPAFTG